jgi:haloalkane dehalogenase
MSTPSPGSAFPFESRYTDVEGFAIHYVEEGSGAPVLFFHGNPTSSYVWRNVLSPVARATGRRTIAFDLLGFGKSAKPSNVEYTLRLHADVVRGLIASLGLRDVVLVGEDWGGPLAAYYAIHHRTNVRGLALQESFLWPMTWEDDFAPHFRTPFRLMRSPLGFVFNQVLNMMTKKLIPENCPISTESLDYYVASNPTIRSRRAMAAFPRLLPVDGEPKASYDFFMEIQNALESIPFPVLWVKATPGTVPSDDYPRSLQRLEDVKRRIPRLVVKDFGPGHHFLAEENPARVAELLSDWIRLLDSKAVEADNLRTVAAVARENMDGGFHETPRR